MTIKVGINGFGRIGRFVLRAAFERNDIEIVGINDLLDADYMAYMLKYDSTHGKFNGTVEVTDGQLIVNGKTIRVTSQRNPADLAWDAIDADVVIESTGLFLTDETARKHIEAGAKKVILSAPSKDATPPPDKPSNSLMDLAVKIKSGVYSSLSASDRAWADKQNRLKPNYASSLDQNEVIFKYN